MPAELTLFLRVLDDDERLAVTDSATVGRHLDNDLIVAGEAVADFHARLARADRGLMVASIAESPIRINGRTIERPTGVAPGDVIEIGHSDLLVEQSGESDPGFSWQLVGEGEGSVVDLGDELLIGRGDDCDLVLADTHVSRRHSSLSVVDGAVWLRDLASANGTFVNGERVEGACQLFHGDSLRFDTATFQFLGRGGDLTPARPHGETRHRPLAFAESEGRIETTEIAEVGWSTDAPRQLPVVPEDAAAGAYLVGLSAPIEGRVFRLRPGRVQVGRDVDAEVWIDDSSVSLQHCEINVTADGCQVTANRTTNGTWLNGEAVLSATLSDGDVLQCAGVRLGYRDGAVAGRTGRRVGLWMVLAAVAALIAISVLTVLFV